jgi:hypothetical protein
MTPTDEWGSTNHRPVLSYTRFLAGSLIGRCARGASWIDFLKGVFKLVLAGVSVCAFHERNVKFVSKRTVSVI